MLEGQGKRLNALCGSLPASRVYCVALSSKYSFLLNSLTITLGKKPACLLLKAAYVCVYIYIYIKFIFSAKALKNGIEVLNTFEEY